jgi:hypothetical protein
MATKRILKKDLINLIVDKAIYLLEEALRSNENAYTFRDYLSEMYNTSTEGREKLFKQFYVIFKTYYGKYLDESKFSDRDYCFPYRLDCDMTESIINYISKRKNQKLKDLQQKLWEWSFANDKDEEFSDFYEVLYSTFHNDLYYLSGLIFYEENPELFN